MPNSYLEQAAPATDTISVSQLQYIDIDHLKALGTTGTYSGSGTDSRVWSILTIASRSAALKNVTITGVASLYAAGTVRIYRHTPATQIIDFQNGSRLTETDLDTAYQQSLYVGQEVAENAAASQQPAVGIGNLRSAQMAVGGIATASLADDAVTNDKLAGGITNAKLVDGTIASAKLAGGITNAQLAGSISLTTKVTGTLPIVNGGSGVATSAGQVLEEFLLPCDGIAYTARSSTYTPTAVTASVALTDTYADVVGSSIAYAPPVGTKIVVYKFITSMFSPDTTGMSHWKIWLGGAAVTNSQQTRRFVSDAGYHTFEWAFPIGGSANPATGRLTNYSDWSSGLIIKMQARRYSTSYDTSLHGTFSHDGAATDVFSRPLIGIKAIG
jgi:hypothetical protein